MRGSVLKVLAVVILAPVLMLVVWLACSPKPPLLDGVAFSPVVLSADGQLLRMGLTDDEKEIILDGCLMNYYAKRN
mgnify:CR=1 FL=1